MTLLDPARVASDPAVRRIVETARAWSAPPSVFMGRPIGPGQPAWTENDRALALALADVEADQCKGCGGQLGETTQAANEERYVVDVAARCHRCTAVAIRQEQLQDRAHPSALMLSVALRPQA